MKVLIVEDIEYRQNFIKKTIDIPDADCTKYAEKGLELLSENSYNLVFLDHDLIGVKSGSYLTQKWFENWKNFQTQKPIVIIHSMNLVGATKMENHLKGISKVTEKVTFKLIAKGWVDLKSLIVDLA